MWRHCFQESPKYRLRNSHHPLPESFVRDSREEPILLEPAIFKDFLPGISVADFRSDGGVDLPISGEGFQLPDFGISGEEFEGVVFGEEGVSGGG